MSGEEEGPWQWPAHMGTPRGLLENEELKPQQGTGLPAPYTGKKSCIRLQVAGPESWDCHGSVQFIKPPSVSALSREAPFQSQGHQGSDTWSAHNSAWPTSKATKV